ncbi:MAG: hypothetical protein ACREUQ_09895 [Burkholderiales bacterium]
MAQAVLGLKTAFEKARLGKGHQAVQGTAYATTRTVGGQVTVEKTKYYPGEQVQPPEGVNSLDWIKSGLKPGKW